ncbi:MAG TPA: NAD-dependent epimerase/dehydratase family protein [Caulobacteraceae bacterium]|nr:NAD-dependent epimerase/dehydratase family protein [Caulobacteraceae bacterium]
MRYAILGGGSVTAEYYLPAFQLLGALDRVTVIDPSQASLDLLSASFAGLDLRLGGAELLQGYDLAADAAIVAAPNALHVPATLAALEAGAHVLCEKPLALTEQACAELAQAAAGRQRLLKVAMSRRYLPSWRLAREMVARRELGEVLAIEVSDCAPFGWRPRSLAFFAPESGGVLADMGVHYLDYLQTLIGPMRPLAYSDDARGGVESNAHYQLESLSGAPVQLRLSRTRPGDTFVSLRCERGEIRIDKANEREIVVAADGAAGRRVASLRPFRNGAHWPVSFIGSFCDMLADFENAAHGRETGIADVDDARQAAGLIEWAYAHRPAPVLPAAASASAEGEADVLITGATGFIGGHLLERLSQAGARVRVTARHPATFANAARFAVQVAQAGVLDAEAMREAAKGVRTVYHLAVDGGSPDARRVIIEGTRNVVEAAIEAGAECVVVLSTMYVFGFPESDQPIDESAPYRPYGGAYARNKAVMERWCLRRAATSGATRIVVLNPSCVFGPGGGVYSTTPYELETQHRGFAWIDSGSGAANYNYVGNLVDAILRAAEVPEAHGQRFIINDGCVTWREFLGPMLGPAADALPSYAPGELEALHRRLERFQPRALARAIAAAPEVRATAKKSLVIRAASQLLGLTDRRPAPPAPAGAECAAPARNTPPAWIAALYGPAKTRFSSARAEAVLGWRPRIGLEEAQRLTRAWLQENRPPT